MENKILENKIELKEELSKIKEEYRMHYRLNDILEVMNVNATSFNSAMSKAGATYYSVKRLKWILACFKLYLVERRKFDAQMKTLFMELAESEESETD